MQITTIDPDKFVDSAAASIKQVMDSLLENTPEITIALSGGNSPLPIYKRLSELDMDWSRVKFFIVDERCVPLDNEQNNFFNLSKCLFNKIAARAFSPVREDHSFEECAELYEAELKKHVQIVDDFPQFDLMILGMGLDGHTASLFPGTEALSNDNDLFVLNEVPQLDAHRLTMTYPVIKNSRKIVFLVQGPEKRRVLELAEENELPVSHILSYADLILN